MDPGTDPRPGVHGRGGSYACPLKYHRRCMSGGASLPRGTRAWSPRPGPMARPSRSKAFPRPHCAPFRVEVSTHADGAYQRQTQEPRSPPEAGGFRGRRAVDAQGNIHGLTLPVPPGRIQPHIACFLCGGDSKHPVQQPHAITAARLWMTPHQNIIARLSRLFCVVLQF